MVKQEQKEQGNSKLNLINKTASCSK